MGRTTAAVLVLLSLAGLPRVAADLSLSGAGPAMPGSPQEHCELASTMPHSGQNGDWVRCDAYGVPVKGATLLRARLAGQGTVLAYGDLETGGNCRTSGYCIQTPVVSCSSSLASGPVECARFIAGPYQSGPYDLHAFLWGASPAAASADLETMVVSYP
jgi:hypothetical protein